MIQASDPKPRLWMTISEWLEGRSRRQDEILEESQNSQKAKLKATGDHEGPWETTRDHGRQLEAAGGHGRPREATGGRRRPREATEGHGRPREATEASIRA